MARKIDMLWVIAIILIVLWLLGVVTLCTLDGSIYLLLVLAISLILIRIIAARRFWQK